MATESASIFAEVIQDHLELKRRNAALEHEMPIEKYLTEDPFENHPLFKTEEQARLEETMDGMQSIVDEPTSLDWPSAEDTFVAPPEQTADEPSTTPAADPAADEPDDQSDERLWSRSRDFDWGD